MASGMADFLANELLDHVLKNAAYTAPATVYLACFTASPTDAYTAANEVADAGDYARIAIAFDAAATRSTDNSADVTFTVATADWTTVTHIGLMDTSAHGVGNMLWWGSLTNSKAIGTGDQLKVSAGDLDVTYSASA